MTSGGQRLHRVLLGRVDLTIEKVYCGIGDCMPLSPGQRLGPYEIVARIGAGGMGEVYEGRDTRLGRKVAIKVMKEGFTERFVREAKAVASLNHPRICTLYDVGPNFLVMEYIEGQPLCGPLPIEQACQCAIEIADALQAAHDRGIIHRDLKPGNILQTESGIKLLDFGLAKLTPAAVDHETLTAGGMETGVGLAVGTIPYMSPEQAEGRAVDARSDIFSLGSVLYELLTGRLAFAGDTAVATLAALLQREPEPMQDIRKEVPEELARIVQRCMRKRAADRYPTAAELKSVLRQARWKAGDESVSVAVLPFLSMNRDEDGEFFADGITEDIISALSKLRGLRVVARSSAFQFKGKSPNHDEVREKLKVTAIVEGTVRRLG